MKTIVFSALLLALATMSASATTVTVMMGEVRGMADKRLDIDNADTTNGAAVQLYECNGSNAQSWILPR